MQKLFKTQLIFFITYITLTVLFFFGWYYMMHDDQYIPTNLGLLLEIPTGIYVGVASYGMPILWFIYLIYNYQVKALFIDDVNLNNKKEFITNYFFPFTILIHFILTNIYLIMLDKNNEFFSNSYLGFGLLVVLYFTVFYFVLQKLQKSTEKTTIIYTISTFLLILIYILLTVNVHFHEAMLLNAYFILSFEYQSVYFFLIMIGIFFGGYCLFGFLKIKNRGKFINLIFYIASFLIAILNLINTVAFFNFVGYGF